MQILKSDITAKIRKAIDDILPSGQIADTFSADTDNELWQAVQHAVEQLLLELPLEVLLPKAQLTSGETPAPPAPVENADGSGYIILNDDFLRFVLLKLTTWPSPVYDLIEPGSDDEKRQRSKWGHGTPEKPKAMLDHVNTSGTVYKVLRYWTAGKSGGSYVHTVGRLLYIPMPVVTEDDPQATPAVVASITCALKDVAEKAVIYRAASIFFEGKKEPEMAEKFRNI